MVSLGEPSEPIIAMVCIDELAHESLASQSTCFMDHSNQIQIAYFVWQSIFLDVGIESSGASRDSIVLSRTLTRFGAHRALYNGLARRCRYTDRARGRMSWH